MNINALILKEVDKGQIVIKDRQLIVFKKDKPSLISIIKALQEDNLIKNLETTIIHNKKRSNAVSLSNINVLSLKKLKVVSSSQYYNNTVVVLDWDSKSTTIKVDTISIKTLIELINNEEMEINSVKNENEQLIDSITKLTNEEKLVLIKKLIKDGVL